MNTKHTPLNKMTGVAMRGGIEIDSNEMRDYPDSNYWSMGARGALKRIRKIVGCEHEEKANLNDCRVNNLLVEIWGRDKSWMEICEGTERVRDRNKALVKGEQNE
jgi:hypothetical protein